MSAHRNVLLEWATAPGVTPPLVGAVLLDASIKETHDTSAEVTTHQVETGGDTADYIRPLPRKFSVEMMITNTPLMSIFQPFGSKQPSHLGVVGPVPIQTYPPTIGQGWNASGALAYALLQQQPTAFSSFTFDSTFDRVQETYGDLVAAALGGALFRITTTLTTYAAKDGSRCMALTHFSEPRSAEEGNVIHGTVEFTEIRFADTTEVDIPAKAKSKTKKGPKTPAVADTQKKESTVSALIPGSP